MLTTPSSRTLILPGLILVAVGLLWRWSGPLRLGRLPGDIVVVWFFLESRHTRTLDGPGKASLEHAIRKQFGKLTRVSNAKRWPEQLRPRGWGCGGPADAAGLV
ncbi:MAG: DUF2905 domain-containing protein [Methylocella sp.]